MDGREGELVEPRVIKGWESVKQALWNVPQLLRLDSLPPKGKVRIGGLKAVFMNALLQEPRISPTLLDGYLWCRMSIGQALWDINQGL